MPRYATQTTVPVDTTRLEIEQCLIKYGASEFVNGWQTGKAIVGFKLKEFFVRFDLPIPSPDEIQFKRKVVNGRTRVLTRLQSQKAYEQEKRTRWRALLLTIKAKLEAVECGITTIENEFLAFIVLANSQTFGDFVRETAMKEITSGQMPKLLGAGTIQDAEIVR